MFVSTPKFLSTWAAGGMSEDALRALEQALLDDPKLGDVIPGAGGLRKARVSMEGRGKRGGGRVLYRDFERFGQIFLFFFIKKGDQEDLNPEQKKAVAKVVAEIENELERRFDI